MPKIYYSLSDANKSDGRFLTALSSFGSKVAVHFKDVGVQTKIVVKVKTAADMREVRNYVVSIAGVKPVKIED